MMMMQRVPKSLDLRSQLLTELRCTMAVRITRSKWPRGRKMSAEGLQVMSTVGTGLPNITPKKSLGSTTKLNDKTSRSNSALRTRPTTTIKKSTKGNSAETLKPKAAEPFYRGSHDPFQRIGTKKPADAVTEMFNMLHKDYHTTGRRRPPINNSMPLKDPHVKH
nr:PREDICTED: uncharacterized protein LOC103996362 isoform X3 [Musa acuminata subsp. malaccensis]